MVYKRIVFCGGGTRCLVFLQGMIELEKKGLLHSVGEYWGTSAGAMIASLYALTKSSLRVKEIMFAADFTKFRDIDITNVLGFQQSWGFDNGTSLIQELEKVFDSIEPGAKSKVLSDIPSLNIVVSDLTVRETVVCNAKTFPNLRVVEALRASMSLPIFFRPYRHAESDHLWVDGAIRANFPWHCLPDDTARSEALGFTFEKPFLYRTPSTFMEYIFSMVHFDEPKKIARLKQWPNIVWFPLPPYPSWFVRLKKEDFEVVENLGREGVENWLKIKKKEQKKPKEHHNPVSSQSAYLTPQSLLSANPSLHPPVSPHHTRISSCPKCHTNAVSGSQESGSECCSLGNFSTYHHQTNSPSPHFQTNPSYHALSYTFHTRMPYIQPFCRRWSL